MRYPTILKKPIAVFLSYILLAPMTPLAQAGSLSSDAVLGAVIGSAAGAAIGSTAGDRNGAAIGGAVGTSISTRPVYREPRYVQERVVYMPPPGWRHRHRHGGEYVYYARPYYPDRYDERYYRRYYDD